LISMVSDVVGALPRRVETKWSAGIGRWRDGNPILGTGSV
jgi:hypothetical protein